MLATELRCISVGNNTFHLMTAPHGFGVDYDGVSYCDISSLVDAAPYLLDIQHRYTLCELANFLLKGIEYRVVRNTTTFRKNYERKLTREAEDLDLSKRCLSDYGTFDLSGLHPPLLKGSTLAFYAEHLSTGLPYKVTVSLDPNPDQRVHYSLPPCKL